MARVGNVYVDVHTKITDRIIADLEKGTLPWRKPWDAAHLETWSGVSRPLRHTGEPYRGINIIMLWWASATMGYKCQYWFTFDQAKALGGTVRKGEKSVASVVFGKKFTKTVTDAAGDDVEENRFVLKSWTVFNGDQCDGLPAKYFEAPAAPVFTAKQRHEASELFFTKTGAKVTHGGNLAFYSPEHDFIRLPPFETFADAESYAATKGHEMVHWTMHKSRLDREFGKRFGDDAYAQEELVAEIGSAFLCADLGITPELRDDHTQYLAHWLKILKGDKRAIVTAASKAQEAVDYLHGLQTEAGAVTAESEDDLLDVGQLLEDAA